MECGRSYLSKMALYTHQRIKHPNTSGASLIRPRGRPKKDGSSPNDKNDFETTKYDSFFTKNNRIKDEKEVLDLDEISKEVFKNLYEGEHKEGLTSVKDIKEIEILDKLSKNTPFEPNANIVEGKKETCDNVCYQYLYEFKEQTNKKYFTLLLKFILLFRECFNSITNPQNFTENNDSTKMPPDGMPEISNTFYTEFMDKNDFFGIIEEEKEEIIEIIQHFCTWLLKNNYTKSKLSLSS